MNKLRIGLREMPLGQKSLRQETTGRMTKKPKNKQQSSFLAFLANLVRNSIFGKKEEKIGILIFKEIFLVWKRKKEFVRVGDLFAKHLSWF